MTELSVAAGQCICIVDPAGLAGFNPQFNPIQIHWMKSDGI